MTLILSLRNCDSLATGGPVRLELDRRGAIIGRSPTVDWTLPDPSNFISSRHCEIRFDGGAYTLTDTSTNGTLINGAPAAAPHRLANGDVVVIGHYEIGVMLVAGALGESAPQPPAREWGGWDSHGTVNPDPDAARGWGAPAPQSAISGAGPMSAHMPMGGVGTPLSASPIWDHVQSGSPADTAGLSSGGWGTPEASPWPAAAADFGQPGSSGASASGWSSAAGAVPSSPPAADIWGRMAESNTVDWARCGFGAPEPAPPAAIPLGLQSAQTALPPMPAKAPAPTAARMPDAFPNVPPTAASAPGLAPPAGATPSEGGINAQFAAALGIAPDQLRQSGTKTLSTAASLLRALVAGMVVLVEARARAKAQMGAQSTMLEFDGNNPLKFARTPEQALAQLLNPPERGFMSGERAIQDAFVDLQSHQVATIKAMQGALRATLDRFSPNAINERSQAKGLLSQILPGSRDAALWRAYVKEFSGVAQGSDEAFMEMFAKEFRKAYEDEARKRS